MKRVSWARSIRSEEGDQIGSIAGLAQRRSARRLPALFTIVCGRRSAGKSSTRALRSEVLIVRSRSAFRGGPGDDLVRILDRKSTRLNSSHVKISYAVFCLKKK